MTRQPRLISVIAPAYNEAEILELFYKKVREVLEKNKYHFELIIIENGSTDGSLAILKKIRSSDNRLQYVSLSRNFGHQGAIIAGLEYSQGDIVICMDADLQHPPEDLPKMIELWKQDWDIVHTKKSHQKKSFSLRALFDSCFYNLLNQLTGLKLMGQSDFRLLDRSVVNTLCALPEKNKFIRGLTTWMGYKQVCIEYQVQPRTLGRSKFRFMHLIKFAIDGIFSFSIVPLRFFIFLGLFISIISFSYGFYVIFVRIFQTVSGQPAYPLGWATLISILLFFFGLMFVGIGIIGEYLGRVYDEVKGRPAYIVQQSTLAKPSF